MYTVTDTSRIESALQFDAGGTRSVLKHGTADTSKVLETNWLRPTFARQTTGVEARHIDGREYFFQVEQKAVARQVEQRNSINGVVIEQNDVTVTCELEVADGDLVRVQIPKALFPMKIEYGLAITLEMVEDETIRRPKVSAREPDVDKLKELRNEIDALIEKL